MNKPQKLRAPMLVAATLASGGALVISLMFRVPLGIALVMLGSTIGLAAAFEVSRLAAPVRVRLWSQVKAGAVAGILATIAYDSSRWLLVEVGRLNYAPFGAWPLFGYSIVGQGVPFAFALAVGTAYHYLNGVAFAIFYFLMFGGRGWLFGVAWALVLEALMFTIYPGWLDLKAVMLEFTVVSVTGHLAYGSTLGALGQRWPRTSRGKELS